MPTARMARTECVCCLAPALVDARGWCGPCRESHTCTFCGAVTASCPRPQAGCGACRAVMAAQRLARREIERREREAQEAGVQFPVCRDPRRDVR